MRLYETLIVTAQPGVPGVVHARAHGPLVPAAECERPHHARRIRERAQDGTLVRDHQHGGVDRPPERPAVV